MRQASPYGRAPVALILFFLALSLFGCQAVSEAPPATAEPVITPSPAATTEAAITPTPATTAAPSIAPEPAATTEPSITSVPTATSMPAEASAAGSQPAETASPSPEAPGAAPGATVAEGVRFDVQEYAVPARSHPHDVAPAADGGVWYTAQAAGKLGYLDPDTGEIQEIALGAGSLPHGVIVGPDDAAWVTDGGLNAIVRVDPQTHEVKRYDLPAEHGGSNLNTAVFDASGRLWFTGQRGIYGVLDTATGQMKVYEAPRGRGPYGITATADGKVYYASLAGSYLGQIDPQTGEAAVLEPPTARQGARRAWADSHGAVWVSEWNSGQLSRFDPASGTWSEWRLPGDRPMAYAVYVDWQDKVWLSDFGGNSLVRFDPETEQFESIQLPSPSASVRQIHGRPGEIWGAESGADKLVVVRVR